MATVIVVAALLALGLGRGAQAATLTVVNTNDSGAGSLRQAIADAAPGDTIDFNAGLSGQTITLTTGELSISKNLTITGPAGGITVSGNNASRVFLVNAGVTVSMSYLTVANGKIGGILGVGGGIENIGTLNLKKVTVSGNNASESGGGIDNTGVAVTLTDVKLSGNKSGTNGGGGGIASEGGTLNLTNVTVSGNQANYGGGIFVESATLNVTNSTISRNSATAGGGGIYNGDTFTCDTTLSNVTVSDNTAATGGGIQSVGCMTLTNVTVSGNTADGPIIGSWGFGVGGGILNFSRASLTNVMVSGNTAKNAGNGSAFFGDGGGIFNTALDLSLTNTTVSGNTAQSGGSGSGTFGSGGGIFNIGGSMSLTNSTVSGNTAQGGGSGTGTFGSGGGILNMGGQNVLLFSCCSEMSLTNVTVSGNTAQSGGGIFNASNCCGGVDTNPTPIPTLNMTNAIVAKQLSGMDCLAAGPITSLGYNLDSDGSCKLTATGDLSNANPLLDPLALNPPGTTKTHALRPGSPAIDHIPSGVNGCGTTVSTDQRGVSRPQGSGCDIGAYEFVSPPTPIPTPAPVGGIVELLHTGSDSPEAQGSASGSSTVPMALAGGAALAALAGSWYVARRRRA